MDISDFHDKDIWKGIILFGLNVATYKMALAKSLLEFSAIGTNVVLWDEISGSFLDKYLERLDVRKMPQLSNPTRQTRMERIVNDLNFGRTTKERAIEEVGLKGLDNVVPRFQTIGRDREIIAEYFYEINYGQEIILKDSILAFSREDIEELDQEIDAR